MNKLFTTIVILLVIFACSQGGGNENQSGGSQFRPAVSAGVDLRLGQISSGSSPVAVSAALENRETITIFSDTNFTASEVVYISPNSETILVKYDQTGRPSSAQIGNVLLIYNNYRKEDTEEENDDTTAQLVDIIIQLLAGTTARAGDIFLPNQAIDPSLLLFLEGDTIINILLGIDEDTDSTTRAWLATALAALRFVACDQNDALRESLAGLYPESFTSALCSSSLLDAVEDVIGKSNYRDISVDLTNGYPECATAVSDEEMIACSMAIAEDIADAAGQDVVGEFPKVATPTPSISENPFINSTWQGTGKGSTGFTGCRNFDISFSIVSTINPPSLIGGRAGTCLQQPCTSLAGSFTDREDFVDPFSISGIVEKNGDMQFVGMTNTTSGTQSTISATGKLLLGGTGSGSFQIDPPNGCAGSFTVVRNTKNTIGK